MGVLKRHEVRYLWQNRTLEHTQCHMALGDVVVVWHKEVPKVSSELPRDEIPLIFDLVAREERGWFIKGVKLYLDRRLAMRSQHGETILEKNDERLFSIGHDNYEFWVSDLQ